MRRRDRGQPEALLERRPGGRVVAVEVLHPAEGVQHGGPLHRWGVPGHRFAGFLGERDGVGGAVQVHREQVREVVQRGDVVGPPLQQLAVVPLGFCRAAEVLERGGEQPEPRHGRLLGAAGRGGAGCVQQVHRCFPGARGHQRGGADQLHGHRVQGGRTGLAQGNRFGAPTAADASESTAASSPADRDREAAARSTLRAPSASPVSVSTRPRTAWSTGFSWIRAGWASSALPRRPPARRSAAGGRAGRACWRPAAPPSRPGVPERRPSRRARPRRSPARSGPRPGGRGRAGGPSPPAIRPRPCGPPRAGAPRAGAACPRRRGSLPGWRRAGRPPRPGGPPQAGPAPGPAARPRCRGPAPPPARRRRGRRPGRRRAAGPAGGGPRPSPGRARWRIQSRPGRRRCRPAGSRSCPGGAAPRCRCPARRAGPRPRPRPRPGAASPPGGASPAAGHRRRGRHRRGARGRRRRPRWTSRWRRGGRPAPGARRGGVVRGLERGGPAEGVGRGLGTTHAREQATLCRQVGGVGVLTPAVEVRLHGRHAGVGALAPPPAAPPGSPPRGGRRRAARPPRRARSSPRAAGSGPPGGGPGSAGSPGHRAGDGSARSGSRSPGGGPPARPRRRGTARGPACCRGSPPPRSGGRPAPHPPGPAGAAPRRARAGPRRCRAAGGGLGVGLSRVGGVALAEVQVAEDLPALVVDGPLLEALLVEGDRAAGVALRGGHLAADEAAPDEVQVQLTGLLGERPGLVHRLGREGHAEVFHQKLRVLRVAGPAPLPGRRGLLRLLEPLPEAGPADLLLRLGPAAAGGHGVHQLLTVFGPGAPPEHEQLLLPEAGGRGGGDPPLLLRVVQPREQLREDRQARGVRVQGAGEEFIGPAVVPGAAVRLRERRTTPGLPARPASVKIRSASSTRPSSSATWAWSEAVEESSGEIALSRSICCAVSCAPVGGEVDLRELPPDPGLGAGAPVQRVARQQALEPLGRRAPLPLGLPGPGGEQDRLHVGLPGGRVHLHRLVELLHRLGGPVAEQGDLALQEQHPGGAAAPRSPARPPRLRRP